MLNFARLLPLLFPVAVLGIGQDACAQGNRAGPVRMPVGEAADAPFGFVDMCARDKALCLMGSTTMPSPLPEKIEFVGAMQSATGAGEPVAIPAAALAGVAASLAVPSMEPAFAPPVGQVADEGELRRMAKRINSQVNRFTIQVPDVGEVWSRPRGDTERFGDCEDLAIEKRVQLTQAGFPPDRMFYAVTFVRGYGLHTVLIAKLDDGDYILDSMVARMIRWSASKQVWLRRQVEGSPLRWVRLDGADARAGMLAQSTAEPPVNPS